MKLGKILVYIVLGVAGLVALLFGLDLALKIPFGREDPWTDTFAILAAALIIWQAIETLLEFKTKKK